jgi:hypothetical protein
LGPVSSNAAEPERPAKYDLKRPYSLVRLQVRTGIFNAAEPEGLPKYDLKELLFGRFVGVRTGIFKS